MQSSAKSSSLTRACVTFVEAFYSNYISLYRLERRGFSQSTHQRHSLGLCATRQHAWDDPCCHRTAMTLLQAAADDQPRARLRASQQATSHAHATHGWKLSLFRQCGCVDGSRASAWASSLALCESNVCHCGALAIDARGTHGLACKRSAGVTK